MTQRGPTLVVCSNTTHASMFLPVAEVLEQQGSQVAFLSLDAFYDQHVSPVLREVGRDVIELRSRAMRQPFYRRPVIEIWRDVLNARRELRLLVADRRPAAVVVGNDYGLIEKAVLEAGAKAGARAVLVQDGRLGSRRPPPEQTGGAQLLRAAKRIVSPLLHTAGLGVLAASEYGEGTVDAICANGPAGATILRKRARPGVSVFVTGQPRYDYLRRLLGYRPTRTPRELAVFTTPFAADALGHREQSIQIEFVRELAVAASERSVSTIVKPHPREDPTPYERALQDRGKVWTDMAAPLIARSSAVILGISTLIEEAAILSRPVIVMGRFLHSDRFTDRLPDPRVFPWVESAREALVKAVALSQEGDVIVRDQRAAVLEEIKFNTDSPAAAEVAEVILSA